MSGFSFAPVSLELVEKRVLLFEEEFVLLREVFFGSKLTHDLGNMVSGVREPRNKFVCVFEFEFHGTKL